jgi:hypothetical protein
LTLLGAVSAAPVRLVGVPGSRAAGTPLGILPFLVGDEWGLLAALVTHGATASVRVMGAPVGGGRERGRGHGRGRAGGLGGTVRVIGAPRVEVGLKPLSDLHLGMRAAHRRVAGAPDGVVLAVVAGKQGPLLRRLLVRRLFSSKTGAPTLRGGR